MKLHRTLALTLAGAFSLIVAACAPLASPTPNTPSPASPTPRPPTPGATPSPALGGITDLITALRAAGATVEEAGVIEQPFFPVTGKLLRVNGADVQAFEFADEATRRAISDAVSTDGNPTGTATPVWVNQFNIWAKGQLIVLYAGGDQAIIDLISGVMGDPLTVGGNLPPVAVLAAQDWLAKELNVQAPEVEIVTVEQAEWPDSCLGLGGANESCAQVVTPGWRAVFNVNGQRYEVRTNETGSDIRLADGRVGLTGSAWRLVSLGEPNAQTPVVEGSEPTLQFEADGQATGSGGCNSLSAQYTAVAGMLQFSDITRTLRACADDRLNQQEQQYIEALESAGEYIATETELTVTYDNGQNEMHFALIPDEAASLAGTAWQLEALGDPDSPTPVIEGDAPTLEFGADGQAGGSGGCNSFGAQYTVQGGLLQFSDLTSTLRACTDDRLNQQEQQYFAALKSAGEFEVNETQLTITYDQGQLRFIPLTEAGS